MNGDLISREALKKKAETITLWNGDVRRFVSYETIDNAPTVDITEEQAIDKLHETGWLPMHDKEMTERPQGEWIIHNSFDGWVECPFCHVGRTVFEKLPKFCENCGADMREGGVE